MDNNVVIQIDNVSKKYCKSLKRSIFYGICDITKNALGLRTTSYRVRKEEFWAVKNISFSIKKGEILGIVGINGSGKTTLLKMISGIFWPDIGRITIKGKVCSLIEIGAGFHPLLTGRENIYLYGSILGMSKKEIEKKIESIIEFAGIEDFIDMSVKHYSSGMFVRLGFAIILKADPDILIIDEALSVGDINFQQKCYTEIYDYHKKGKTILLVTHDYNLVRNLCTYAILLDQGSIIYEGLPADVSEFYLGLNFKKMHRGIIDVKIEETSPIEIDLPAYNQKCIKISTGEVELLSFFIKDDLGNKTSYIKKNTHFIIGFEVLTKTEIKEPHYGIAIFNNMATQIYSANTYTLNKKTDSLKEGEIVRVNFQFNCILSPGWYSINIGISNKGIDKKTFTFCEYLLSLQNIAYFEVIAQENSTFFTGIVDLDPKVDIEKLTYYKK